MYPLSTLGLLAAVLLRNAGPAHAADAPFLGPLAPLEVSNLIAPCGSASDVGLTVTNPNQITAGRAPHAEGGGYWSFGNSTAICYGQAGCAEISTPASSGRWSFEVLPLGDEEGCFDVKFTLDYNVTRWGGVYYKVLEGTGHFELGAQLVEKDGGDDGGCEFVLADGSVPVLVPVGITDCQGTC